VYYVLTCNGYTVEATAETLDEAVRLCSERELATLDSYARVVSYDGRLVADADGPREERHGSPPYDAATATGMYDAW